MYRSKVTNQSSNLPAIAPGCWRYWLALMVMSLFSLPGHAQVSLNVTDFGAVGDAVQFHANTVSNSFIATTTNVFSTADIGKAIEVFGCGPVTAAPNCQDLVATITNVVNGTNLYLNQTCQRTLTNTFATVGTDNSLAFSNAIQSVVNSASTNTIINVPTGKYLCLANYNAASFAPLSILIKGGGWHLIGEGTTNSILIGNGAWTYRSGYGAMRGFLLAIQPPVTNDYPVSIENLTLDGGVEYGNTSNHGFPASVVDGNGWDETHDAIDVRGGNNGSFTHWTWTNLLFTHWRGEIVKSNGQSTNGNLTMVNCTLRDGNASAINIYDSLLVTNCVFENMFMMCEYFMKYSTNTSYFVNNVITNITGNAMSFNGGSGINAPFVITGNQLYNVAGNGFATTPGDNITVTSNQFYNVQSPIVIGAAGYQGTFINSNIVVSFNTFSNSGVVVQLGSYDPASSNVCSDVWIYGNSSYISRGGYLSASWSSNIYFYSNTAAALPSDGVSGNNLASLATGQHGSPYLLIPTNNFYWTPVYDTKTAGYTNFISYGSGSRYQAIYQVSATNACYVLVTSDASQIPTGASVIITNSYFRNTGHGTSFPVYLNSDLTGDPVMVTNGTAQTFYWNKVKGGFAWMTHQIIPPLNLRTNL